MKHRNKNKLVVLLLLLLFVSVGCTKQLKNSDNKVVTNPMTGQSLTENILCRPEDEETINLYIENNVDVNSLPSCKDFNVTSGGYEGIWTSIFIKPLAWVILTIGEFVKSNGLALIITSLLIRFIAFPITRKTAIQSELMQKAKPELDKLEKKYANKKDNDSMMRKSQEMAFIYKKYNINPIAGCLYAMLQLPLFIAFLEAINRVPAIFEENFLEFQLGTTPVTGITNGNFIYIIITIFLNLSPVSQIALVCIKSLLNCIAFQQGFHIAHPYIPVRRRLIVSIFERPTVWIHRIIGRIIIKPIAL